jgi:dolichol-phosphate mannosyltransferase
MDKKLVIIPTYNEKENIENIIRTTFSLIEADILIIEDNSPDGTADIVKKLIAEYPDKLFIEERKGKLGLGTAYIHGFKWGIARNYDFIFEMDADFSHNPDYLPDFIEATNEADLVIGSRYIGGKVNVINWPLKRLLLSYYGNMAARIIAGIKIMDCTGGFKCFRANTLREINLDNVASSGYSFQVEMNFYVQKKGLIIKEIPIVFKDRELGVSKMSSKIISEAFALLWKLRLKSLFSK